MNDFYASDAWLRLGYRALRLYGNKCMCCGARPPNVIIQVDHVKSRSKYPRLALKIKNLQILCKSCNLCKSNIHKDDWLPKDWKTRLRVFLNIKA